MRRDLEESEIRAPIRVGRPPEPVCYDPVAWNGERRALGREGDCQLLPALRSVPDVICGQDVVPPRELDERP